MARLEERFRIHVATGLHARVAMRFAEIAALFRAEIEVERAGKVGDGKNALGVLMLVAGQDDEILVRATGPDAREALVVLAGFVLRELGAPASGAAPGSDRLLDAAVR